MTTEVLFLSLNKKKLYCGYSLALVWQADSNEHPQCVSVELQQITELACLPLLTDSHVYCQLTHNFNPCPAD